MGASAYIGRVGRLAVALGVGTAIVTGHGIASADGTDTTSSTSAASDTSDTSDTSDAGTPANEDTAVESHYADGVTTEPTSTATNPRTGRHTDAVASRPPSPSGPGW